ncbi:Sister chromatid cohesion protein pds5 [Colletotrichum tanaceti]|uniref:Sister chromatid cohesion protein pds5 n=1 Tax=Colletotrichum tanaceti TaxID=1306861 RepID=A0A4U6XBY3_9PEZI|nr:Sister chromatid cohesion protein pds5 [Colletotrichum tanaceti]TKW53085.1 Sister chromatid cohesion protein pds5 [Colletotrichum tanaceti]
MAPRRGRAEPQEEVEEEQGEELVSLQFDEELTWKPGKPIPTTELLNRLQTLSEELGGLDQDTVDVESLNDVAHALGQRNLLVHKDKGVRAYAAVCIADILRLCAPDAPFTADQTKMFFNLVVTHIFPSLNDQAHPYHSQHKYVLTALTDVKSILLINDVDGADDMLLKLFSVFFDGVSGSNSSPEEGVSKEVRNTMTEMLIALVDEASGMNPKVIEVIMAQFLRAAPPGGFHSRTERGEQNGSQSTLLPKDEPAAYLMAKEICNVCTEKMVHYVSQYFSDVILDASRFAAKTVGNRHDEDEDEDAPRGPTDAELKELKKAHYLIRELWRAAPSVLQNVIPQVEAELSADNVDLRQLATETLGDMISGIGAAGPPPPPVLDPAQYPPLRLADEAPSQISDNVLTTPLSPQSFAQTHSSAYNHFLGRRNDKTATIRAAWTTAVGYILATSAGGIGLNREEQSELVKHLGEKLNDGDEKVRLAAVKVMELFSFRDFVTKLAAPGGVDKDGSVLSSLADRCRDKRTAVRVDAMTLLAKLWAVGSGELAAGQESVVAALAGIPSRIFNAFYANDSELNILLDRVLFECLVPLSYPPIKAPKNTRAAASQSSQTASVADQDRVRAERILLLTQSLDAAAKRAFFAMQGRQPQFAQVLEAFINQCESYNGGVMDDNRPRKTANLERTVQYITQFFPDPFKVKTDLQKFANLNDRRAYQLVRFSVSAGSDYKTVRQAIKELVKRINASQVATSLDTLLPLLYRSACLLFNRSHLATILDYSRNDKDGLGSVSHEILNEISQRNPELFKTHVGELCKGLIEQAPTETNENDSTVVDTLKACASYSKKYPEEIPQDRKFSQALVNYALYGRPVKSAKYAIKILLAKADDKGLVNATSLLEKVMEDWTYGSSHFLNRLQSVAQLELQAPKITLDSDDDILDMTVQQILLKVRTDATDKDPDWVEDADVNEELQAKCLSMHILVNRLRSMEDVEEAKEKAVPVFKLLKTLVAKRGELCKTKDTPDHHKSRLRLLAAQLLLKLCTVKHFDDFLTPADFNRLAFTAQDPHISVRRGFIEKLQKYLVQGKLRARFYTIVFLTAFEPTADLKQRVETWIRSRVRALQMSEQHPMEAIMGRLISLLAHHPDFTKPENVDDASSDELSAYASDLADHGRYILYYLANVATEDNLGLIYKYAERVKQTRDAIDPEASVNLYIVSDLAQAVIRKWQERKNWSFQAYPGKVGLPIGLYTALPSHQVAQEIAEKQYLPAEIDGKLDGIFKSIDRKKKRKSVDEKGDHQPAKKARQTPRVKEPKAPKEPKVKKQKVKKPAKVKTRRPESDIPPENRRRSGRATRVSQYTERDSSDDDREMWDGVSKWQYVDGEPEDESDDEDSSSVLSEAPDEENGEKGSKKSAAKADDSGDESPLSEVEVEAIAEPDAEPESEKEEEAGNEEEEEEEEGAEEATPPPKSNGRKGRSAAAAAASKTKLPARPATKEKPTPRAATRASARTTRGRAAKESMDIDESE